MLKIITFILYISLFVSCASGKVNQPRVESVYITNTAAIRLLPPDAAEEPVDMFQQVTGSYGRRQFTIDALVIINDRELDVTLLNPFGTTIGHLSYTGDQVSAESPFFPKSLKSEYIIADFQLCFYHPEQLKTALNQAGLLFTVSYTPDSQTRQIQDTEGNTIIRIQKDAEKIEYSNIYRNYSYTIYGDFNVSD